MRATVVTSHFNDSMARSIEKALKADNRDAPEPLQIVSRVIGKRVISTIKGAQDVESLLATIDDLLLCIMTADRVLCSIKTRNRS